MKPSATGITGSLGATVSDLRTAAETSRRTAAPGRKAVRRYATANFLVAADACNGSGQQAAQCLSQRLRERGISACLVSLPDGHDPNSFLVQGGDAPLFQSLLEAARP